MSALEERPLLRLADVAERLAVSVDTLLRMRLRGELALVRVGGQWRVEPAELERYLEAQRQTGEVS